MSGNPKGRPKGAKNLSTLIAEKLADTVSVRENGRQKRMTKGEIGVTKLVNRFAESGDAKLFLALKGLEDARSERRDGQDASETTQEPSATDQAILDWYVAARLEALSVAADGSADGELPQ